MAVRVRVSWILLSQLGDRGSHLVHSQLQLFRALFAKVEKIKFEGKGTKSSSPCLGIVDAVFVIRRSLWFDRGATLAGSSAR